MAKRNPKLFNITALHQKAISDVAMYHSIVDQLCYLIQHHPEVQQGFLVNTLLEKFEVTEDWFSNMQYEHRQSIIDSVRGKYE